MTIKTRENYLEALRKMRPNIYKFGDCIKDVTTHPATKRNVESHALSYDASNDEDLADLYTTVSKFTGEKIHRWNSMMQSSEDLILNMKMKRKSFHLSGNCTGAICVGFNAQNAMWAVTHEMDKDNGTNYQKRLKNWILESQKKGWTVAAALTDAKGNRSLKPSQQENPDSNLRIVEVKENGVIVRGAKLMIAGIAASQEILVLPGTGYKESDKDFAFGGAIPRDIEGLTIIEATHPSDRRELEENGGAEVPNTGITQGLLLFDNVFIPNERVFMCGEYKYSTKFIGYFSANYRACIGSCTTGQGDVIIGASILMARANGLSSRTFTDKLVKMSINNQITYGLGAGACVMGSKHPSGSYFADPLTAHTTKVMVATLPYEVKRISQEIGGGIVEIGCMPSYKDFTDPNYGEMLHQVYKAGDCSAEARLKIARLNEWLTIGGGVPGCMHGGGSPDGARLMVRVLTPFEEYAGYAKKIMNIKEDISEPQKKK